MPTPDEIFWRNVAAEFSAKWNFPHCIGEIDGKHILDLVILITKKNIYYYTVLLGLVDADYKFITVDVGDYGKKCDSTIFLKQYTWKTNEYIQTCSTKRRATSTRRGSSSIRHNRRRRFPLEALPYSSLPTE